MVLTGSSPLARGLHLGLGRPSNGHGIIPARAGFTMDGVIELRRGGIIPARAGFTEEGGDVQAGVPDHPRSRGVYNTSRRPPSSWIGSSPLARGLLHIDTGGKLTGGIIPARAGFTSDPHHRPVARQDHPRSRGVYAVSAMTWPEIRGSSPLARGLRGCGCYGPGGGRIIPARAGFTLPRMMAGPTMRDHPRSRGVYCDLVPLSDGVPGSSPLARGLRARFLAEAAQVRIIPARAGFTPIDRHIARALSDHPRSRGVYEADGAGWSGRAGSSPLARGLRARFLAETAQVRIIPARAGFTARPSTPSPGRSDHPRSRGVYVGRASGHDEVGGSSPLARGLPQRARLVAVGRGIIPARAGFTPAAGRWWWT